MRILVIWLSLSALLFSTRGKVDKVCEEIVENFLNAQINKKLDGYIKFEELNKPKDEWRDGYEYCEGLEACPVG